MDSTWQVVAVKPDGRRVTLKDNVSREDAESLRDWASATRGFATVLIAPGAKAVASS